METSKKLTREEAIATYLNHKEIRVLDIAAAAGVTPQTLYQWLEAAGVKPNRRPSQQRTRARYASSVEVAWTAEEIKALRIHMELTQKGLAEELGVRQQTISEWETGMYRPRGGMSRYLTLVADRAGFVYRAESGETHQSDEP